MAAMATPSFASQAKRERPISFISACSVCGQERLQHAYTRRALLRLIKKKPNNCRLRWDMRRGVGCERAGTLSGVAALSVPAHMTATKSAHMTESVCFASMCPKCAELRPQRGYTRVALLGFLTAAYKIEAYCLTCDEFWPISASERDALARALRRGVKERP
jgi:hypothetical protein